ASCNFSGSVMGAGCDPVFGGPESTPTSMPFSLTIRLKTSPTERTPWPGFQSYLPDITRASPVNLSESVPASFPKAACIPAGCACANGPIRATASAQIPYRITILFMWNSAMALLLVTGHYAPNNLCGQEK